MKVFRWVFIIWSVCATLLILLATVPSSHTPTTETRVFCAYSRLFVEFEESGKRWGTIMLDFAGTPIPCHDDKEVKIENTI